MRKAELKVNLRKTEIKPRASYNVNEVAKLLNVHPETIRERHLELGGRRLGNGFKFLGENLLSYMGSPSVARMNPNK